MSIAVFLVYSFLGSRRLKVWWQVGSTKGSGRIFSMKFGKYEHLLCSHINGRFARIWQLIYIRLLKSDYTTPPSHSSSLPGLSPQTMNLLGTTIESSELGVLIDGEHWRLPVKDTRHDPDLVTDSKTVPLLIRFAACSICSSGLRWLAVAIIGRSMPGNEVQENHAFHRSWFLLPRITLLRRWEFFFFHDEFLLLACYLPLFSFLFSIDLFSLRQVLPVGKRDQPRNITFNSLGSDWDSSDPPAWLNLPTEGRPEIRRNMWTDERRCSRAPVAQSSGWILLSIWVIHGCL